MPLRESRYRFLDITIALSYFLLTEVMYRSPRPLALSLSYASILPSLSRQEVLRSLATA